MIEHIATQADISKASAGRALDAILDGIKTALQDDGVVVLAGFGSFCIAERPARAGRDPRTGDIIQIKSARVPKFKPGKALREAVN